MESEIVRGIGLIVVLGIGLQWLARTLHLPSIVLLLVGGLVVGPGLDVLDPDDIFGDALFPVVSLAVGLLLFNGGLELRIADLRGGARTPVLRLVSLGALVTWVVTALAVHLVFDEPLRLSVLLGAVLVVSGPTVVGPLLRLARPTEPDLTILQWEGILIDPIGATLGLFCLNAFFVETLSFEMLWGEFVAVALSGAVIGLAAAAVLVVALRRFAVPDELEVAAAVMLVVAAYVTGEVVRPEAGLFATTAMGLGLANQPYVPVDRIRTFGEPVVALLIGTLFIVLAAGVDAGPLADELLGGLALSAVLVLVVRPLAVAASTARTALSWRERAFLACMAPRGVVAAATAALFSLRLEHIGQGSEVLMPVTFAVIIALAVVYGLGSVPAARLLGVARPRPRGALLVGDDPWLLALATELAGHGVTTVVAARGRDDLAGRADLPFTVYPGAVHELPDADLLADVRAAVVASGDDLTDVVAVDVLADALGRGNVWLLTGEAHGARVGRGRAAAMGARRPFAPGVTHQLLARAATPGHRVVTVDTTDPAPDALVLAHLGAGGSWRPGGSGTVAPGERAVVVENLAPAAAVPGPGRAAAGG